MSEQWDCMWEDLWGAHIHHGFYDPADEVVSRLNSDHRAAQLRILQEALRFAGFSDDPEKCPNNMLDVGCGTGGTARYIARTYGTKCRGININPVEIQKANTIAEEEGLADKVSFQVANALELPFPDGEFDLVWSLECAELVPDKRKFVSEMARVAAPGASIVLITQCHRDLRPSEDSLQLWEKEHLKKICDPGHVPDYCSHADYVNLFESLSIQDIKRADWTQEVAPSLPAVIRSFWTWKALSHMLRGGKKLIKSAWVTASVMSLLDDGYQKGLIKYGIIVCKKPK